MAFHNFKWSLILFVLASTCLNGCTRRLPVSLDQLSMNRQKGAPKDVKPVTAPHPPLAQKAARSFTPFEEIVFSLVTDSLDLLPNNAGSAVYEVILKGIEIPDQYDAIDKNVLFSSRKEDIALVAGLIVQLVYGESIGKEAVIPQAILFIPRDKVTYADIAAVKSRLSSSENRNLDAYNACLSLLVSSISSNYGIQQKDREGLYLRDSKNNLYFHKRVSFHGNVLY